MAKRIKSEDLFEGDLAAGQIQSFLKLLGVLEQVEKQFVSIAETSRKFTGADTSSVSGIRNLTVAHSEAAAMEKEIIRLENERIKAVTRLNALILGYADATNQAKKELEQAMAAEKAKIQTENELVGTYQRSVNLLNSMKQKYLDLFMAGEAAAKGTLALKKEIDALDEKVKLANAAVGNFQRNVGNYSSAFGKYTYAVNSLQQVLRELPNFAFSARIGFMAISNNIPILVEQFQRVKEEMGSTTKALGIFVRSVFSVQSAVLIFITLSNIFADEIGSWIKGLFSASDATKALKDRILELNKEIEASGKSAIKTVAEEASRIKLLTDVLKSETTTLEQKKRAKKELNEIAPDYLAFIEEENIGTERSNNLMNTYISNLQKKAKAQAMYKQLSTAEEKIFAADIIQKEDIISGDDAKEFLGEQTFNAAVKAGEDLAKRYNASTSYTAETVQSEVRQAILKVMIGMEARRNMIYQEIESMGLGFGFISLKDEKETKQKKEKTPDQIANDIQVTQWRLQQAENRAKIAELDKRTDAALLKSTKQTAEEREWIEKKLASELKLIEIGMLEEKLRIMKMQQSILPNQLQQMEEWMARIKLLKAELGIDDYFLGPSGPVSKTAPKQDKKTQDDTLKNLMNAYKEFDRLMQKHEDLVGKRLDRQISASQRRQTQLRELAAKGLKDAEDNLALEEKKELEFQRKQDLLSKRQQRRQLLIAGLQTYSNLTASGDPNALGNTINQLGQLIGAVSALPTFFEGTENVEESLGKPHLPGTKDRYVIRVDGKERIFTGEQNAMIGDMSNEEAANILYNFRVGASSIPGIVAVKHHDDRVVHALNDVKQAIEQKPDRDYYFSDTERAIIETIVTGQKVEKRIHQTGGLWQR